MNRFETLISRLPADLISELMACTQDPLWHPEGDVYTHIRLVFEQAEKLFPGDNDLLVAAIFHDLGKPETREVKLREDGTEKITNYGHEFKSLNYVDKYFHLYDDLTTDKNKILALVKGHMKAHQFSNGKLKKPSKREAFKADQYFEDIMKFSKCDEMGR